MTTRTIISKWEAKYTKQFSQYDNKQILSAIQRAKQGLKILPDSNHHKELLKLLKKEKEKRNL